MRNNPEGGNELDPAVDDRKCCKSSAHQWWLPPVMVGGPCDVLRAEIGMTINLTVYATSVAQRSTILNTNNCTILFGLLSTHLHRFRVIK